MKEISFEDVVLSFLSFFTAYVVKKVLEVDKGLEVLRKDIELIKELVLNGRGKDIRGEPKRDKGDSAQN